MLIWGKLALTFLLLAFLFGGLFAPHVDKPASQIDNYVKAYAVFFVFSIAGLVASLVGFIWSL